MFLTKLKTRLIVCFFSLVVSMLAMPNRSEAQVHALCRDCADFVQISATGAGLNRDVSTICEDCKKERNGEEAVDPFDQQECATDDLEEDTCPTDDEGGDNELGVCGTPCTQFCDYTTQRLLALCEMSPDIKKCKAAAYSWLLACYSACMLSGS